MSVSVSVSMSGDISLFDEYELVSVSECECVSVSGDISLFDEYELVSVSVSMSECECEWRYLPL